MPITLTVGTNTYISLVDAETYLDTRLFADVWTAASADDKARAVIMATKKIDRLTLEGAKKTTTQKLEFPRRYPHDTRYGSFMTDATNINQAGEGWYAESDVPQAVLDAVCEEALALLASANDSRRKMQRAGVKSFTLGSLSESFYDNAGTTKANALISQEAKELMKPFIAGAVRII